jgi:hypothetical protein
MNVGILYKSKLINIEDGGIRLSEGASETPANNASEADKN